LRFSSQLGFALLEQLGFALLEGVMILRPRPRGSGPGAVKPKPRRGPRFSLLVLALGLFGLAASLYYGPPDLGELRWGSSAVYQLGPSAPISLLVAARDTQYCGYHTACGPGMRTDTIFYVRLQDGEATLVAIPRDLHYEDQAYQGKINGVYEFHGAEGLRRAVENVLGVPVQHYAILTFEAIMKLIAAVDGVDVTLKEPMKYTDRAAGLFIDFPAGKLHLDGKDAVKYMRFRRSEGNDLGRLDRVRGVLQQVLRKAQQPRYWPRLPGVANVVWTNLETTLPIGEALKLLPALKGLSMKSATIPTIEEGNDLAFDPLARAGFIQGLLDSGPIDAQGSLEILKGAQQEEQVKVLILDQSGKQAGQQFAQGFAQLGLSAPGVLESSELAEQSAVFFQSGVSIVGADSPAFRLGQAYAGLLHLPLQSKFRLEPEGYDVVVLLGKDWE
jgi:LCP family protein required for cell wall assembly